jgi:histone H3/H4
MKEKSFRVYIFRLLKTVCSDVHITKVATEAIDSIIRVVAHKIVDRALILTAGDDKKTLSHAELETSVKMLIPQGMDLNEVGMNAVQAFTASELERAQQPVEKAQTRESRSGLIMSVSATEKYIRRFGQVGYNVSALAPVYLAGVLESFVKRLLSLTAEITKSNKKVTITIRHIFLAVSNDQVMNHLLSSLGVVFLEGGVTPQTLENKRHKRLRRTSQESRGHRWRPGTKTIMDIRRLQKSGDMLMQHAPFNRVVRTIAARFVPTAPVVPVVPVVPEAPAQADSIVLRFTNDFFLSLQAFVEDRMVKLMTRANSIAVHAGRETVYARDIELVCTLIGESLVSMDDGMDIPEASLRHLALRAGIKRYGDCCTEAYRRYLCTVLTTYLKDGVFCALHHGLQTLSTKTLQEVMYMNGLYPTIIPHKRKTRGRSISQTTSQAESLEDGAVREEGLAGEGLSGEGLSGEGDDKNEKNTVLSDIEEELAD